MGTAAPAAQLARQLGAPDRQAGLSHGRPTMRCQWGEILMPAALPMIRPTVVQTGNQEDLVHLGAPISWHRGQCGVNMPQGSRGP
ncbi:hypothetical protein BHR42_13825 [Aeromonas salmonicida subsp. salmonicida]|nr:hypothetical protein BHR42_13825 [Aeromonas salmonicida subsp. salmonicida]